MRISVFACGLAAAALFMSAVAPAVAADPKSVFPESSRAVEGGRKLTVLLAQAEIASDINQSNVVVATGGGLLGALIDAKINSDRAKKAELEIQPLRAALTGFDVDSLALEGAKASSAKIAWLNVQAPSFGRDTSILGMSAALDASPQSQTAFFIYVYDTSPDFSSIRVSLTIQVANKAVPDSKKPEARLQSRNLVYYQTITSVISLASPSKVSAENVARWDAAGGKLARKALAMAFDQVGSLEPRALELTSADIKTMSAREKKFVFLGGYSGRLQEEGPQGSLLFNGALVHVQTLAE